jgi:hypothetical protein
MGFPLQCDFYLVFFFYTGKRNSKMSKPFLYTCLVKLFLIFDFAPQNNEITRGTTEVVISNLAYRVSSHRRESAALHKLDIVWLYRSPIPVRRRGMLTRSNDFYLPSLRLAGGGSAPCAMHTASLLNFPFFYNSVVFVFGFGPPPPPSSIL